MLHEDDVLVVAELSRLGRNLLELINLINQLSANGVKIICNSCRYFVRQDSELLKLWNSE